MNNNEVRKDLPEDIRFDTKIAIQSVGEKLIEGRQETPFMNKIDTAVHTIKTELVDNKNIPENVVESIRVMFSAITENTEANAEQISAYAATIKKLEETKKFLLKKVK